MVNVPFVEEIDLVLKPCGPRGKRISLLFMCSHRGGVRSNSYTVNAKNIEKTFVLFI